MTRNCPKQDLTPCPHHRGGQRLATSKLSTNPFAPSFELSVDKEEFRRVADEIWLRDPCCPCLTDWMNVEVAINMIHETEPSYAVAKYQY